MAIKKKQLKKLTEKAATATLGGIAKSATKKPNIRKVAKSATTGATTGARTGSLVAQAGSAKKKSIKAPTSAPKPKAGTKYFDTATGKTGTVYNAPTEQLRKAKKMMNSLN